MSPQKYRDRIYFAAVRLLEANGVTGDFTGDLDFYAAVDAVLEEMNERDVDAGRFNRKASRDIASQLAVIDRKLESIQCGSGTGETCDCLICNVRWIRAQLAASEAAVATLRSEHAEQRAVIEAVKATLWGQPVSDFLLSFPPVRRAVDLHTAVATLTEQLAYWKTCANCGVEMTAPGHCDTASLELSEGWTEECAKHRERQEVAEAAVATLRTDLGTALSVGVAQHAEIATLRQALTQLHMDVTQTTREALAAVPAPAAPPRPMLYFAQRQHPTDYGMVQVSAFKDEAERDELLITWKAENPGLHPYGWEREVESDVFQDIAAPAAPQEP